MNETLLQTIITAGFAFAGSALVAGIYVLHDWRKTKKARKDVKEDRAEAKKDKMAEIDHEIQELKSDEKAMDNRIDVVEAQSAAIMEGVKFLLLDTIIRLGKSYIARGEITFEERRLFHKMHDTYHDGLNGNGDADLIVEAVDELPLTLD